MKKLGLLVLALCMAVAANAQKGQMALGGNLNFGIDDGYNNVGIGPKFQYNFAEKWRGEASFDYFFEKDKVDVYTFADAVPVRIIGNELVIDFREIKDHLLEFFE